MTFARQPKSLFGNYGLGFLAIYKISDLNLSIGSRDAKYENSDSQKIWLSEGETDIGEAYLRTVFSLDFNFERTSATES